MTSITPIYDDFGAEITGISLADGISKQEFEQLRQALDQYAVLVLPDQPVDEEQQLAFALQFGPLDVSIGASTYNTGPARRLDKAELSDISNLSSQNTIVDQQDIKRLINLSNQLWHTDSSFKRTPASFSILAAQEVAPVGGATEFADMRAAWDALPEERQQELEPLIAIHDYFHSRQLTGFDSGSVPEEWHQRQPPVPQVLVRTHPASHRKSLYLASHISHIQGLSSEASQALIGPLMEFATQRKFVYRHRWRRDDVVIWDNRCTMHRGRPFDEAYRRAMRRATVQDAGPTVSLAS